MKGMVFTKKMKRFKSKFLTKFLEIIKPSLNYEFVTVSLGDSENDILPANQLGMFSVHVTYGYGKLGEKINADLTIEKIKELRKIF